MSESAPGGRVDGILCDITGVLRESSTTGDGFPIKVGKGVACPLTKFIVLKLDKSSIKYFRTHFVPNLVKIVNTFLNKTNLLYLDRTDIFSADGYFNTFPTLT